MSRVIDIDNDIRFKDPFDDFEKYKAWFVRQDYLHFMILWFSQSGYTFTSKDHKYLELLDDYIHPISNQELRHVWVFGSNLRGIHGKGAALSAKKHHNAATGLGEGISQGQFCSYALPTKDRNIKTLDLEAIQHYIENMLVEVITHPNWQFTVTRVGCGLAGLLDSTMQTLFNNAFKGLRLESSPPNLDLPALWSRQLDYKGEAISGHELESVMPEFSKLKIKVCRVISTGVNDLLEKEAIKLGIDIVRVPLFLEYFGKEDAAFEQTQEIFRRSTLVATKVGKKLALIPPNLFSDILFIKGKYA